MLPGDEQLNKNYIEHWVDGKLQSVQLENSSIPISMDNVDYCRYIDMKDAGIISIKTVDDTIYKTIDDIRRTEYEKNGCDANSLIVALWEKVVEDRPESANALQAKRLEVKDLYPKN